ncbi:MAG: TolC family protein, partial [Acidobacteriota bacterium]|nr:TolC family protein [Acidobacteriota bacterium]
MLLVILAAVAPARARADEPLTLEQAMTRARAGALEAQAASALVAAGDERLRQARSYRKPQVRLQEIWTRTDSPAEAFGLMLNQERFSLAEFSAGDPNDPNPIENALTRFEVELPVYTGGEIGGRIRQAELAATGARQSSAWVEDQAAWAAGEAYVRLLQAREQVSLLETTIAAVDAHVALARAFVEQGMLVRSEQLRAEVEAARVRELVIEAHGRTRVAAANLGFRLGEDGPRDWRLESLVEPQPPGEPLEAWLASADQRLDLEAARRQVEAGELEEPILLSALKPKIGLLARHDRYDRSLFGSSGTSSAVLAVASIDLFAGGRHRAAAASARAAAAAAALEVERFRQGIRLEVR